MDELFSTAHQQIISHNFGISINISEMMIKEKWWSPLIFFLFPLSPLLSKHSKVAKNDHCADGRHQKAQAWPTSSRNSQEGNYGKSPVRMQSTVRAFDSC